MTAAAVDYLPQNALSEAQIYFKRGLSWSGLSPSQWTGDSIYDQRTSTTSATLSGVPVNVAGAPGLPGSATGVTPNSTFHWTVGGQFSGNFPTFIRALKRSYFASRFSVSAVSSLSSAAFNFMLPGAGSAAGYLGYLGGVSAGNFMVCDSSGANKLNGPAIDALEHVHEIYLNPNGSLFAYVVDGISYGGNAALFINNAGNNVAIRWRVDNGADAVDRRILPRWIAFGTDGS
jgi:hypothetical protein